MSKIIDGIVKDLKAIPETLKAKTAGVDKKKLILMNLPYILAGYFCDKIAWLWRVSPGSNAFDKLMAAMNGLNDLFSNPLPSFSPKDLLVGIAGGVALRLVVYFKAKNVMERTPKLRFEKKTCNCLSNFLVSILMHLIKYHHSFAIVMMITVKLNLFLKKVILLWKMMLRNNNWFIWLVHNYGKNSSVIRGNDVHHAFNIRFIICTVLSNSCFTN